MAFENVQIQTTKTPPGSLVVGYRDDLAPGDLLLLSLTDTTGVSSFKWSVIGRPEESTVGGVGPEPCSLGIAATASFTVDNDAPIPKDGTYIIECLLNESSPTETRIRVGLVRFTGATTADGRPLRKIGGFEQFEDTSDPTTRQGYATMVNRWLQRLLETTGGSPTFGPPINVDTDPNFIGVSPNASRADHKHDVSTDVAGPIAIGDAAAEGVALELARADHVHSVAAPAAPADVTKAAASAGISPDMARADHKHDITTAVPISIGAANLEGTSTALARADHQHDGSGSGVVLSDIPPVSVDTDPADAGVGTEASRNDHKHDILTAVPVSIGTSNQEGTSVSLARADHVHDGSGAGAPLSNTAPVNVTKAAAAAGVAVQSSRQDHKHDISTAAPGAITSGDAAAEGTSTSLARADHVHSVAAPAAPADVTKAAAAAGVSGSLARADHKHDIQTGVPISIGASNLEGTATTLARSDHQHAGGGGGGPPLANTPPVDVTKAAASAGVSTDASRQDHKHDVTTAAPVTIGGANAEGTSTALARADHVHDRGTVAVLTATAPVNVQKNTALVGSILEAARSDHRHDINTDLPISIGLTNVEGTSTSLARADHQHATPFTPGGAPLDVTKSVAVAGVSGAFSRQDHKHDISTAVPVNVGALNLEGTSTSLARADHVHAATGAVTTTPPVNVTKAAAAVGVSLFAARDDHKHDVSTATPLTTGTVLAEGTATTLARSDHVHSIVGSLATVAPLDVTKSAAQIGTSALAAHEDHKHDVQTDPPDLITVTAIAEGTSTRLARADHHHGVSTATPVSVGTSNNAGTSTALSRADHVHDGAGLLATVAPVNVTKAAAAVGTSAFAAREDHKHDISTGVPITIGASNLEGTATTLARSDHQHAGAGTLTSIAPLNILKQTASAGTGTEAARNDHKHDINTDVPVTIGTSNVEGSSTSLARADHQHATPFLPSGGAPPDVDRTAASAGASSSFARADHKHDITVGTPVTPTNANAGGSASTMARSDHVHNMPGGAYVCGASSISAGADTRWFTPGYDTGIAGTTEIQWAVPRAGHLRNLHVRNNAAPGGATANNVVYTVFVNGVATALTVTRIANAAIGQTADTTNSVAVNQGDRVSIQAVKAASIGSGSLTLLVTLEFTG